MARAMATCALPISGDGDALDHTARKLGGIEVVGVFEPHALETEIDPFELLGLGLLGEKVEGQLDILLDGRRIEQGPALENHADVLADGLAFAESEVREVGVVVAHAARVDLVEPHEALEQHGFARTALADDKVGLAGIELDGDVVEHRAAVERLDDMLGAYHIRRICVSMRLKIMMTTEPTTTARVEAAPTSSELPLA